MRFFTEYCKNHLRIRKYGPTLSYRMVHWLALYQTHAHPWWMREYKEENERRLKT